MGFSKPQTDLNTNAIINEIRTDIYQKLYKLVNINMYTLRKVYKYTGNPNDKFIIQIKPDGKILYKIKQYNKIRSASLYKTSSFDIRFTTATKTTGNLEELVNSITVSDDYMVVSIPYIEKTKGEILEELFNINLREFHRYIDVNYEEIKKLVNKKSLLILSIISRKQICFLDNFYYNNNILSQYINNYSNWNIIKNTINEKFKNDNIKKRIKSFK